MTSNSYVFVIIDKEIYEKTFLWMQARDRYLDDEFHRKPFHFVFD